MGHAVTLELSEEVYQHLLKWAQQEGRTPEAVAAEYLTNVVLRIARDPLLQLAGSVESEVTDASERHDEYIGQALFKELRSDPDE